MLMRWDPFGELDRLTRWASDTGRRPAVAMDAFRREDRFVMTFDVPGIDPDSIDLTVQDNVLTLRAERRTTLDEYDELLVHERPVPPTRGRSSSGRTSTPTNCRPSTSRAC